VIAQAAATASTTPKGPFKFYIDPFGDIFFIDARGTGYFGMISP